MEPSETPRVGANTAAILAERARDRRPCHEEHSETAKDHLAAGTATFQVSRIRLSAKVCLLTLAVLAPVLTAYAVLIRQSVPAPIQDDYHAILDFALKFKQSPGWISKTLWIVSAQHNEYKLIFEHAIVALNLALTGRVNFALLNTLGNLFLLPLSFLLWLTFADRTLPIAERLIRFVPVSLIFFSLTYWQTLNWAMAGLQNLPVILFAFLAIYLLAKGTPAGVSRTVTVLAIASSMAAALSSANGFLMLPIGLVIFLRQRKRFAALLWCLSFSVPLGMYLFRYTFIHIPIETDHLLYMEIPLQFFAFLGSAFAPFGIAVLAGLTLFIAIISSFRSWDSFSKLNQVRFYLAVFILGSAAMVAWGRGPTALSAASRYAIYSNLAIIFVCSFIADRIPGRVCGDGRRWVFPTMLMLALLFCIMGDIRGERNLAERRQIVLTGLEHYRANPNSNSPLTDPVLIRMFQGRAKSLEEYERIELTRALQNRLYVLPDGSDANLELFESSRIPARQK